MVVIEMRQGLMSYHIFYGFQGNDDVNHNQALRKPWELLRPEASQKLS